MPSRGQAWAEYIIVLAVVIIMAGVAMYLAGGFPSNSKEIEERDSAAYWFSADVGIIRYNVNSTITQFVIKNNRNFRIRVTNITSRGVGNLTAAGGASSVILNPGQTAQVNVTGLGCSSGTYSLPLLVVYQDVIYGNQYSLQGEKSLVGKCMGSSSIAPPPECSADPECGINETSCNPHCDGNQNCTYLSNPATCQRSCSAGKCSDCSPQCGSPSCTSCGTNTTACPPNYCSGNQPYTYPPSSSCSIPCTVDSCTNCNTPQCTATAGANCGNASYCSGGICINCPAGYGNCDLDPSNLCEVNLQTNASNCGSCGHACSGGQICQSGVCVMPAPCPNGLCDNGENYLTCKPDCCRGGMYACTNVTSLICHQECAGFNCTNFKPVCENRTWSYARCTDSSGGSAGVLDYYVTCCNGTIYQCAAGKTCNQSSSSTINCVFKCLSNCTRGDGICQSSCSGACSNFRPVCDAQSLNAQRCSDATGTTTSNTNYTTCCNGAIASAPGCYQNTSTTVGWCGDATCDAAHGETYSTCPQDCCNADCTGQTAGGGSDNTCHQQCSSYCISWQPACDNRVKGTNICIDSTRNVTCCNSTPAACSGTTTITCPSSYCDWSPPYDFRGRACTYPATASCSNTCSSGAGSACSCNPTCTVTCTTCAGNRYCCECTNGSGVRCLSINQCNTCGGG